MKTALGRIAASAAALSLTAGILTVGASLSTPANAQGGGYYNGGGPGPFNSPNGPRFPGGQGGYRPNASVHYRGTIDDRVNLFFRGDRVRDNVLSGKGIDSEEFDPRFPLPRGPFHADLADVRGRGRVFIFQQPSPDNGWTVGVRVYDPQPGAGHYSFRIVAD